MTAGTAQEQGEALVLTLDVGTSSARSAVYDAQGSRLHQTTAQRRYLPRLTLDGGAEHDADALLEIIAALIDETLQLVGSRQRAIRAVATATFWHSLLGLDEQGQAVTPVYLWMDGRSHLLAATLRERLNEREVHARTGCVLHWSYLPAKLLWVTQERPALARRVRRWVSFGDYVMARLFGTGPTNVSIASATGLFDQHRCDWDEPILSALGLSADALPALAPDGFWFEGLRSPWRERWPHLHQVPWLPPAGDGALSNVGAGCTTAHRAALMVGTSVALRVVFRAPRDYVIPEGVWAYRLDRDHVCLGGSLNDGGSLLDWAHRTLQLPDRAALEAEVSRLAPDAHGLTLLPLWGGERSPGWAGAARGVIVGMGLHTKPIHVYRAALEGIALRCAELDTHLCEAVPRVRQIIATGGALLGSPAWVQIMADVLGRPITPSAEPEASSRGAALVALDRMGLLPGGLDGLPAPDGAASAPRLEHHGIYQRALRRQRELYRRTIDGLLPSGDA